MKTILDICQEAADLAAVKRPEDLFNKNSQQDSIFLSVAKSTLDSLLRYGNWEELTKEGCLTANKGQSSYLLSDYVQDFYCLICNTIYIKDMQERVIGAITPEQWMKEKYFNSPSNDVKFKLQNGRLIFLNPPSCRMKIVFQYRSNNIVWDYKTLLEKNVLTANTDVPIFDEYLVKLGILWRWLKRNGMDYSEEYDEYEKELKKRYGSELATKDICLASNNGGAGEEVIINVKVTDAH